MVQAIKEWTLCLEETEMSLGTVRLERERPNDRKNGKKKRNQEKGKSDINRDRMTKEAGKSNRNETKRKSVRNFNDRKVKDERRENLKEKENSVHKKIATLY